MAASEASVANVERGLRQNRCLSASEQVLSQKNGLRLRVEARECAFSPFRLSWRLERGHGERLRLERLAGADRQSGLREHLTGL